MRAADRRFLHLATWLVGGTGLVYAGMRYLMEPDDPFAVVHHPWQPHVQHLHVLTAPLLVFAAGLLWRSHVVSSWRSDVRHRRRSGAAQVLTLVPMIASGYLIQVAVDEGWRKAWIAAHLISSALWMVAFSLHLYATWRRRRHFAAARLAVPPSETVRPQDALFETVPARPQTGPRL